MGWLEDLGKSLPVDKAYDDICQPAAQEVGSIAKSTVKAARFILAPIDYLAAQQDRFQKFLKRVSDNVPEENFIPAHPQIAGPIMDNLKYIDEDNVIATLFINLLSRAVDKERVSEAHPAFVNIISQLSPDEALLINYLSDAEAKLVQTSDFYRQTSTFGPRRTELNDFPVQQLAYPENYLLYMDHLHSLNLAGIWQAGNQDPIMSGGQQSGVRITSYARLTCFGHLFAKACVAGVVSEQ
ncbi:DUF4393 domain-containing protein [Kistimonas asteriae]|uniref:DUF4393 domain-containing protein n=1 Tax=Kistimonas asteriae TaxID=517724 RepID=UPI001BAA2D70|nr:DUF4393 domain-containing protein [Kistimonas asteriae]